MCFYLDFPNPALEQRLDRWDNAKIELWIQKKEKASEKRILRIEKRLKRMKVMSKNWRSAEFERLEMQTYRYKERMLHREREQEMWD